MSLWHTLYFITEIFIQNMSTIHGSFWVWAQPMRDDVTISNVISHWLSSYPESPCCRQRSSTLAALDTLPLNLLLLYRASIMKLRNDRPALYHSTQIVWCQGKHKAIQCSNRYLDFDSMRWISCGRRDIERTRYDKDAFCNTFTRAHSS